MTAGLQRTCNVNARAKLNLSLRVLAREQSGYHQIETLFCTLELADELEVTATGSGVELEVLAPADAPGAAPELGPASDNLAVRAARAFCDRHGGGARIRLTKRIPAGAGLGGGSSDAAAVLRALNDLHANPLSDAALTELGGTLGADVPFFVAGAGLALAWGRGDRIAPLPPLPSATVLLVVPPERIATAEAYADLARERAAAVAAPAVIALPHSWSDVAACSANDFESVAFRRHPRLRAVHERMQSHGARVARMTGSGSAIFGVFDELAAAHAAAATFAAEQPDAQLFITRTVERLRG